MIKIHIFILTIMLSISSVYAYQMPNQITVVTEENRARLCPNPSCDVGKELQRIETGTTLTVLDATNVESGISTTIWFKVNVGENTGWVSEFDVEVNN